MSNSEHKVKLVFRSVSGGRPDFPLEFAEGSTIQHVKDELSKKYPGNPSPASQKLIFAGRLLQDEAALSDILKLVCILLL
jgi:hypothetical protein